MKKMKCCQYRTQNQNLSGYCGSGAGRTMDNLIAVDVDSPDVDTGQAARRGHHDVDLVPGADGKVQHAVHYCYKGKMKV